jgi:hypothetical protein|tara:strand:+ start:163 stop:387 length:225 start_codon:yes stop_codon:yes gene_type:complete
MALSKKQNKRLGAILSVMFEEETPKEHLDEVVKDGFVSAEGGDLSLTPKGMDEKNRLCTLAGLNIRYTSEKQKD